MAKNRIVRCVSVAEYCDQANRAGGEKARAEYLYQSSLILRHLGLCPTDDVEIAIYRLVPSTDNSAGKHERMRKDLLTRAYSGKAVIVV